MTNNRPQAIINGVAQPMTDDQYADYLRFLQLPVEPPPNERLAKVEAENAELRKELEAALLILTGKETV